MCGFAGFFSSHCTQEEKFLILEKMGNAIFHRGPDDNGVWLDENAEIGFSHRRLAIQDLSSAGHQPMISGSGRYVLVFNGEIYNHFKLRNELKQENIIWNGYSDTETLLACFDLWGVLNTVKKATGMFAFAVWDKHERKLTLGRDRMGEKPLYYGWQKQSFLFGSELKALKLHPDFCGNLHRGAISLLIRHGYIPAPYSVYENIFKLEPGCLLELSKDQRESVKINYWSVRDTAVKTVEHPFTGSAQEALNRLEFLATQAVKKQMLSDVSLGAFLSGGIDSSTVVALMQAQSVKPVKTFAIGFNEQRYNEAEHARSVAKHLGTEHYELYVSPQQALSVIPKLPHIYDEPFADSSQIPTFLVASLAKEHVTVALSGDGGDELFFGYQHYTLISKIWKYLSFLPGLIKTAGIKSIEFFSPVTWNKLLKLFFINQSLRITGNKLYKGIPFLKSSTIESLYYHLMSLSQNPESFVISGKEPLTHFNNFPEKFNILNDCEKPMALDMLTYLPDDILTKVDRAAMYASLETRVPFLDHEVVEFVCSLPFSYKYQQGTQKWLLKQLLYKYVPEKLVNRPKMGFSIPLQDWLKGPLKDWAMSLLDATQLEREDVFYPSSVRKLWHEHLDGHVNRSAVLWNILMFQAWFENNKKTINLNS